VRHEDMRVSDPNASGSVTVTWASMSALTQPMVVPTMRQVKRNRFLGALSFRPRSHRRPSPRIWAQLKRPPWGRRASTAHVGLSDAVAWRLNAC